MFRRICIWLSFACALCACSPLREAQHVVDTADSLRVHAGVAFDDSLALADAVRTLSRVRLFRPDDYARACYYYGRLLRTRGDQIAAMQTFLSAAHADPSYPVRSARIGIPCRHLSDTDHDLLGRVYSNIAFMCHLVDDFQLSFEMYDKAAAHFRKSNNDLSYYYALYNMAFELAVQSKSDEAFDVLSSIERACSDSSVLALVDLTKAVAYRQIGRYDSAICYANRELRYYRHEPTGILVKAQSFSCLNQNDSAIYYADLIMRSPSAANKDRYNALYILSHADSSLNTERILSLTSDREDINNHELNPQNELLAQALQLLQQDLDCKPDYKGLVLFVLAMFVLGGCSVFAIVRIRQWRNRVHANIEQVRQKTQQEVQQARQEQIHMQIVTQQLLEQQENMHRQHSEYRQKRMSEIESVCAGLKKSENLRQDLCWADYDKLCNFINANFNYLAGKLAGTGRLNEREIRLCILVLIGLSWAQMSDLLNYSLTGIGKFKDTTAKKLGTTCANLSDFLRNLSVGE